MTTFNNSTSSFGRKLAGLLTAPRSRSEIISFSKVYFLSPARKANFIVLEQYLLEIPEKTASLTHKSCTEHESTQNAVTYS
jgi:hypothetical protein